METKLTDGAYMPAEAFIADPKVQWGHVDGPLMTWAGHLHWLTWAEHIALRLRITSVEDIAFARFPSFRHRYQTATLAAAMQSARAALSTKEG